MTKKGLNALRSAMYSQWITTPDGKSFIASQQDHCKCWRISEGEKRMLVITYYDSQINKESLSANGFTEAAKQSASPRNTGIYKLEISNNSNSTGKLRCCCCPSKMMNIYSSS